MVITNEWIGQHATASAGWTRAQLERIGVSWPPLKGWRQAAIGREITESDARAFVQLGQDRRTKLARHVVEAQWAAGAWGTAPTKS